MASMALEGAVRHLRQLFGMGSAAGLGDEALLARYAASKDEHVFETLVERHGPMVLATCRAVLQHEHDAEDAFQATFLVLARKAGTIRAGDALGGWLHRVALRISIEATHAARRRRQTEREAMTMALAQATRVAPGPELDPDSDWQPILHHEIDRLPEGQRLPVVLCDLEGLTYEQAASQLGWSVPKFRSRLARARQRLRDRLTRRGVEAPALLVPPALPAALVRATVAASTRGPASAAAAMLAQALVRGMLVARIKAAFMAACLAVAALAGVIAASAGDQKPEADAVPPAARLQPADANAKTKTKMVEVRGIVVGPDGRPVAGAAVRATHLDDTAATPVATSGPDGRFVIRLPRLPETLADYRDEFPWIIASASGAGIGWTKGVLRNDPPDETVVKLTPEGPPIKGRILDLEGRPVAGARVRLSRLLFDETGPLDRWIARARNGAEGNLWQHLETLAADDAHVPLEARTGPDGRFTLTGVGRDRIASLLITGEGIATTPVDVFSRAEPELRIADRGRMRNSPQIVHAPRFQLAVAPAKRVEGVVRDKHSGRPIAGVKLNAGVFDEHSGIAAEGIEATTDAEGQYRLDGLPRAAAYRIFVEPAPKLPYPEIALKAPATTPAFEPVTFDIALTPGIVVRGRVTEKGTGRPVMGYINYYAFADNPHLKDYPGFAEGDAAHAYPDEQGRYTLVALPGRGIIGVRDEGGRSRPVADYKQIPGFDPKDFEPQLEAFRTVPEDASIRNFHVLAIVDFAPGSRGVTRDIETDPGRSVDVEVVGPDGRPVGEIIVKGTSALFATSPEPHPSPRFTVHALAPGDPRRVVVSHKERKLIGSVFLKGDEAGPIVVKLEPWGTVRGRIVDDEGRPRKGMFLMQPMGYVKAHPETNDILPGSDWNNGVRADDDGRFVVEGLVPGLHYGADSRAGFDSPGLLFQDVVLAPGEDRDLGNLKVEPPKKKAEEE